MPKANKKEAPSFSVPHREETRWWRVHRRGSSRTIVDAILDEEMPEFQQSAWIMTNFFKGMSAQEISFLAEEMMLSGEVIEMMDVSRPKIEKYSTGGVGDKTTLVLGPLAAVAGVAMPMMNGDRRRIPYKQLRKVESDPKDQDRFRLGGISMHKYVRSDVHSLIVMSKSHL